MALGLCCEWVEADGRGRLVNQVVQKSLQLGRLTTYAEDHIRSTYLANITGLLDLLRRAAAADILFVRISSSLFPLFDKVQRYLWDNEEVHAQLKVVGEFIAAKRLRVNTHPGQFVVLSSDNDSVVRKSIVELDFHGWLFDRLGLPQTPYYGINVHGGKGGRSDQLIRGIAGLSESARRRLTLENDEFAYSVDDLLPVCRTTGVPLVFDVHHHSINPGQLNPNEALAAAVTTWPQGVRPTTHLSNSRPENREASVGKRRIHSDYIDTFHPVLKRAHDAGLIDIEVEAKAKNLAIAAIGRMAAIQAVV